MKIKVLQQDLLPVVQSVARSSGVKATLPVLANILLQTEKNKLKLSATNLEIGVIKEVSAEIIEEGDITIPGKIFQELIQSLDGELTLEVTGNQLTIKTSKFSSKLNGIPATEFPQIPLSSDKSVFIDAQILSKAIPEIAFAAAVDEGRPILTGILTQLKKNTLELVATDGFRLSHKYIKAGSNDSVFAALIPKKTFEEVVRLIQEEQSPQDKVEVSTAENQNQMVFKIGNTQISSRLIEGQFPSWEKIIPQEIINKTIVNREEALKSCKIASIFAKGEANIIKINAANNKLKFQSEAKELGNQENEIDAKTEGEEINIAFNSKYLIEALSATSSSQLLIEFSGNLSPALIKPVGEEGLEYVIMPIRLS